jgi:hypothetical protein
MKMILSSSTARPGGPGSARASRPLVAALALAAASALAVGLLVAGSGVARAAASSTTIRWGRAATVPGLIALNTGGNANVLSVSCPPKGNCAAGGFYTRHHGYKEAFVVSQARGHWGKAIEVPGTAALNVRGNAQVSSVSCNSGGVCAAAGYYTDKAKHRQAFVVTERNGRWGDAIEVPGTAALNIGGYAQANSVSCAPGGICAAVGQFSASTTNCDLYYAAEQAYVTTERNGRWGTAQVPAGLPTVCDSEQAALTSVSCPSAGNCAAAGSYQPSSGENPGYDNPPFQGFVVSEKSGRWGAIQVPPGLANINAGEDAGFSAVSCSSAGNCGAGGFTLDNGSITGPWYNWAMVAIEKNGHWQSAQLVSTPSSPPLQYIAGTDSISCAAAGDCSAGGSLQGATYYDAFAVSSHNGNWATAALYPGTDIGSVSCVSAGNCGATSNYTSKVIAQMRGRWGKAVPVPGLAALGPATVWSVSCERSGNCAVGGWYADPHHHTQAFLDT